MLTISQKGVNSMKYAKFNNPEYETSIIAFTAQYDNSHSLIFGLGENGIVYSWDKMYAEWAVYQPDLYKIPKRTPAPSTPMDRKSK